MQNNNNQNDKNFQNGFLKELTENFNISDIKKQPQEEEKQEENFQGTGLLSANIFKKNDTNDINIKFDTTKIEFQNSGFSINKYGKCVEFNPNIAQDIGFYKKSVTEQWAVINAKKNQSKEGSLEM